MYVIKLEIGDYVKTAEGYKQIVSWVRKEGEIRNLFHIIYYLYTCSNNTRIIIIVVSYIFFFEKRGYKHVIMFE